MQHKIADLSKLEVITCLYHRAFFTQPHPTLHVTVNGEHKEYCIRYRAARKDKLYHAKGLPAVLIVYDGIVLAYEIYNKDDVPAAIQNIRNLNVMIESGQIDSDGWYFDTEKFYRLDAKRGSSLLTIQDISVLDPIHLTYTSTIEVITNAAFVITNNDKVVFQSSPVASNLTGYKEDKLNIHGDSSTNSMFLSLNYLLKLCDTIVKIYGHDEIEKFDISQYILRHKTVNLRKLPLNVLDNSTTNVTPKEAILYLCGLIHRESDFDTCITLLKTLKTIIRGGIVNANNSDSKNVYLSEIKMHNISHLIHIDEKNIENNE